jgi:membrane protease YdiL (CAAX protease family)
MLIVSTMLIYTLKIDLKSLGFRIKNLPIQIPIALLGLLFGLSFSILIPIKLPLSLHTVPVELFAAEIFIVIALGALEGFVFQGLLLNTLQNVVKDRLSAPIFVAMIYASLFLHTGALPYVALVFGTTLFFNYLTIITRNVIGTCVAYGLINLVVFVIVPMGLIPGIG